MTSPLRIAFVAKTPLPYFFVFRIRTLGLSIVAMSIAFSMVTETEKYESPQAHVARFRHLKGVLNRVLPSEVSGLEAAKAQCLIVVR